MLYNNFMKKKIVLALILILLFGIAVFSYLYFFKSYQTPEERERQAIKDGLKKTLPGEIAEIDSAHKLFVVDLDPLGKHELYTIHTNKKTTFLVRAYSLPETKNKSYFPGENMGIPSLTEERPVDFNYLKTGMNIEVNFSKRINVDTTKTLTAETVIITEINVLKNEEIK